jgi:hypothetical protein
LYFYNDFGKQIFNHYVYSRYIESDIYNNGSFSEFQDQMKKDLSYVYDYDNCYAMIGGYLIWCLATIDLVNQILDKPKHPENRKEKTHYFRISGKAKIYVKKY